MFLWRVNFSSIIHGEVEESRWDSFHLPSLLCHVWLVQMSLWDFSSLSVKNQTAPGHFLPPRWGFAVSRKAQGCKHAFCLQYISALSLTIYSKRCFCYFLSFTIENGVTKPGWNIKCHRGQFIFQPHFEVPVEKLQLINNEYISGNNEGAVVR